MRKIATIAALLCAPLAANAATVTTFDTSAGFAAASPTAALFESFTGNVVNNPDLTVTGDQRFANNRLQRVAGRNRANSSDIQSTTLSFTGSFTSFSAVLGGFGTSESFDLLLDGVLAQTISGADFTGSFFGFTSDTAFSTITFADPGRSAQFNIDELTLAAAPAPVPLPAGAPLLLAALGGLGFAARRKAKSA